VPPDAGIAGEKKECQGNVLTKRKSISQKSETILEINVRVQTRRRNPITEDKGVQNSPKS